MPQATSLLTSLPTSLPRPLAPGSFLLNGIAQGDLSKIPPQRGLEITIGTADTDLFRACSERGFCLARIEAETLIMRLDFPDGLPHTH